MNFMNPKRRRPQAILVALLLTGAAACVPSNETATTEAVRDGVATNVRDVGAGNAADRIQSDVSWLADDARQGREAGTQGYLLAADYVAERFKDLGVLPGNGDSYFQTVNLRITKRVDDVAFLGLTKSSGEVVAFQNNQDYIAGRSVQGRDFDVSAPVVFVGYGVSHPDHDDYAGLDVNGKIVAIVNGAPETLKSDARAHFGRRGAKEAIAFEKGAVGMITLTPDSDRARQFWRRATAFPDTGSWGWVAPTGEAYAAGGTMAPTFTLGPDATNTLFAEAPMSFAEATERLDNPEEPVKGFALPVSIALKGSGAVEDIQSPNVVGIIEGSDPVLKKEVIVLSAHLDHVGVYEPRGGGNDHIHNGAMDNAMGISTMLEVARRFQEDEKPRRTVVFLAVTAEEKGLLGSDYYANFPTVRQESIVGNVNLDMPLVLYPFSDVVAFGAERSTLGETVRAAAANTDVEIIPDPWPQLRLFTRSDHYSFVKQGVPSVFLFLGTGNGGEEIFNQFMATNYHQPTDQIDLDIHWDDAARFANLNYLIAREIADADDRPRWKEGDFFGEIFSQ